MNENIKRSIPQEYLRSIRNLCITHIQMKNYQEAEELLNKTYDSFVSSKKINDHKLFLDMFILFTQLRMDIIISTGTIDDNVQKIPFFQNEFKRSEATLQNEEKIVFYYFISLFYLQSGNYKIALRCINKVRLYDVTVRKDLHQLSLIAELVIHYFLGNSNLLNSKLLSYKRLISKNEFVFSFEKNCLKTLTQCLTATKNKSLIPKLQKEVMEELEKEQKAIYKPFISLFYLKPI